MRKLFGLILVLAIAAGAVIFATSRSGDEQRATDVPASFPDEVTVPAATTELPLPPQRADDRAEQLSLVVAGDAQRMWSEVFTDAGTTYRPATVKTFRDGVSTKCGDVDGSVGPFYCPAESGVFLDLGFHDQLQRALGGRGDFAWAYVVAHEIAHHVQQQTGVLPKVNRLRAMEAPGVVGDQGPSVRSELQADCYAGVWIHSAYRQGGVRPGDLRAAQAIGDDALQSQIGEVHPDTFTHGSSEQRMRWLSRGFETGQPAACDTFALPRV